MDDLLPSVRPHRLSVSAQRVNAILAGLDNLRQVPVMKTTGLVSARSGTTMTEGPDSRILVGVDEDLASMRAVEAASKLACAMGHQVDLLTVLDVSQVDVFEDFYRGQSALQSRLEHERIALLHTAVHRLGAKLPRYRARLRHGSARHILLEEAAQEDVSMLVLGKSGKPMSERFLLGSVARELLRKCPVPLLLVGPFYT